MIRKLEDFRLSAELNRLAHTGAVLLANGCQERVDQASEVQGRVERFFLDNAAVVKQNVDAILLVEQTDVPELLRGRSTNEERKEDPSAGRQSSMLVDVLEFDIASLIARRNGLGPATSRNGLRERVPAGVARGDCNKHMHAGYRFILANALLRMAPDPLVRTNLVSRPRELLRDDLDAIVAGSSIYRQAVGAAEHTFVPVPDPDLEVNEVTRAREAYRVALGNAVRRVSHEDVRRRKAPIPTQEDILVSQGLLEGAARAGDWLDKRAYRDATMKQLDEMLREAVVRRRLMTEPKGGALHALFAESLRAAHRASSIKWDADLEARIREQERVTRQAESEVHALAEHFVSARGTGRYKKASDAFALAVHREIPEVYCHKATLKALREGVGRPMDLTTLMKTRMVLALDILAGASV